MGLEWLCPSPRREADVGASEPGGTLSVFLQKPGKRHGAGFPAGQC